MSSLQYLASLPLLALLPACAPEFPPHGLDVVMVDQAEADGGVDAWRLRFGEEISRVTFGIAGANGATWRSQTTDVRGGGEALLSLESLQVRVADLQEELGALGADPEASAALFESTDGLLWERYRLTFEHEGRTWTTGGILPGATRDVELGGDWSGGTAAGLTSTNARRPFVLRSCTWRHGGKPVGQPVAAIGPSGALTFSLEVGDRRVDLREHAGPGWALFVWVH